MVRVEGIRAGRDRVDFTNSSGKRFLEDRKAHKIEIVIVVRSVSSQYQDNEKLAGIERLDDFVKTNIWNVVTDFTKRIMSRQLIVNRKGLSDPCRCFRDRWAFFKLSQPALDFLDVT